MPNVFDFSHTVRDDEIDELGHANNLAYLAWMQSAAIAHSSSQGWTPDRYRSTGIGWVARSHKIEYLQPAFIEDAIIVRTWVANLKKVSSLRRYDIVHASDNKLLATAETNWVFVNLTSFKPTRIPIEVEQCFDIVTDR